MEAYMAGMYSARWSYIATGILVVVAINSFSAQEGKMKTKAFNIRPDQSQLFLDDELVANTANVRRVWHQLKKHPANPLILKSGNEKGFYLFGSVLREPAPDAGGKPMFRMWYYARGEEKRWVGYARSEDGLKWEKPELGLIEIAGNTSNNAIFLPDEWIVKGISGVIKDPDPDVPDNERYKLVQFASGKEGYYKGKVYLIVTSPDGLHWTLKDHFKTVRPCKPDRACLVWDPFRRLYALYNRAFYTTPELMKRGGKDYRGRAVALCTSKDWKKWTRSEIIMTADAKDPDGTDIYSLMAFPCGGQWAGLPQLHYSLPEEAYIDVGIAHSRDGVKWKRERGIVVLPCGGIGEWDRFNQAVASCPVRVGDELWVYYSGRLYRHGQYKPSGEKDSGPYHIGFGLAVIRLDGWCSLEAGFDGGEITTRPVILPEGDLYLNAKCLWGSIAVEILDEQGKLIARSDPVITDGVSLKVSWPEGNPLAGNAGKPVQLKFILKNALLYSWKVNDE